MKWFDRWFMKKVHEAMSIPQEREADRDFPIVSGGKNANRGLKIERDREIRSQGMTFTLYRAVGGYVLETNRIDERADRRINDLYMIDEEKDFAQQVAHAISMESMKL